MQRLGSALTFAALAAVARRHWYFALLPLCLFASLSLGAATDWRLQSRAAEGVLLFDWCLFVPLLYFLCYRARLSARAMALRLVALVCFGVWFAGWVVPDSSETLLIYAGWLRPIGLAVLLIAEAALLVAVIRLVFSGKADVEAIASKGVPPLLARWMLLEARFWRWVWSRIRR